MTLDLIKCFSQQTDVSLDESKKNNLKTFIETQFPSFKVMFCPRVYSEEQPGDAATALFIKKLSEEDAGEYRCSAVYASNQRLEAKVDISVYSE